MFEEYPEILTVKETMEILGISRVLLYDLIHSGTIPAFRLGTKIWRIKKVDLILFIESN